MSELSVKTPDPASLLTSCLAGQANATNLWAKRRHLLDTKDLTRAEIDCLFLLADACKKFNRTKAAALPLLASSTVATVFYENSTRTASSFELAALKLGARVINLNVQSSSIAKGETITDTAKTLASLGVDGIVQRHPSSGSAHLLASTLPESVHVINAGDGWNAHPTQGLLDLFTMLAVRCDLSGAKVAIIGDIMHSRVARSNIWLLKLFGADIHLAGPPTLMPAEADRLGLTVHNRLEPAIEQADFVMALRLQMERQKKGLIPGIAEYKSLYRLDHHRLKLAGPQVKLLHPGPVNRGLEITDELAGDKEISLIAVQVENGLAIRMAALYLLLGQRS